MDKGARRGYCFSHFADVNNMLSSVSWPVTIRVAKQTQNQSEFSSPNSAWKKQITAPQSHKSLVSPKPCQHPGQYRDGAKQEITSAGCLMAWPLGFWIWDDSECPSVSPRQDLSDLEFQSKIILSHLSHSVFICLGWVVSAPWCEELGVIPSLSFGSHGLHLCQRRLKFSCCLRFPSC